jgi:hypothetical protein
MAIENSLLHRILVEIKEQFTRQMEELTEIKEEIKNLKDRVEEVIRIV